MLGVGLMLGSGRRVAGPSYDPDAATLFAAFSTDPGGTRKGLYNDLILGLKADGLWAKLDTLYLLAAHDAQAAVLNVRAPGLYAGSVFTGLTFTADRGFLGGGTGYIDTGFNPVTAGGQFSQNSAHIGTYTNAATADAGSANASVGKAGQVDTFIRPRITGDTLEGRVNNTSSNQAFGSVGTRLGSRVLSRIASGDTRGFVNGVQNGAVSMTASVAMLSGSFTLLRLSTSYNTTDRLAAASIGGGLSGAEAGALHSRVLAFLTAIGAA